MPVADLDSLAAFGVSLYILGIAIGALASLIRQGVPK